MSYELYRASVGLDNNGMIAALAEKYPKYAKATQSMINNPDKYGVCLLPEAEALLISAFGFGPGLVISEAEPRKQKPKLNRPRRSKPNRMVVYLPDELYLKVRDLMAEYGFETVQDFLQTALSVIVEVLK